MLEYPQGCFSQQKKRERKNLANKAISSNYGKSVTSMVFCLCEAKAVKKNTSITDGDIRLNKTRQGTQPKQDKHFHKEGSPVKERLRVFSKIFLFVSFNAHAVFQTNRGRRVGRMTLTSSEGPQGPTQEGFSALKAEGEEGEGGILPL